MLTSKFIHQYLIVAIQIHFILYCFNLRFFKYFNQKSLWESSAVVCFHKTNWMAFNFQSIYEMRNKIIVSGSRTWHLHRNSKFSIKLHLQEYKHSYKSALSLALRLSAITTSRSLHDPVPRTSISHASSMFIERSANNHSLSAHCGLASYSCAEIARPIVITLKRVARSLSLAPPPQKSARKR